ncbi:hypothetical protein C0J52_24591 [Blattella germanica]|nr:hypothetical protein C0J52_24591 [Blattella germanica]
MDKVILLLLLIGIGTGNMNLLSTEEILIVNCVREIALRYYKSNSLAVVMYPSTDVQYSVPMKKSLGTAKTVSNVNYLIGSLIKQLSIEMEWDVEVVSPFRRNQKLETKYKTHVQNIGQYILILSTEDVKEIDEVWNQLATQIGHFITNIFLQPRHSFVIIILRGFGKVVFLKLLEVFSRIVLEHGILNFIILANRSAPNGRRKLVLYTSVPEYTCGNSRFVKINEWIQEGNGTFLRETNLFPEKLSKNVSACELYIHETGDNNEDFILREIRRTIFVDIFRKLGIKIVSNRSNFRRLYHITYPFNMFFNDYNIQQTQLHFYPYISGNLKLLCSLPKTETKDWQHYGCV